MVTRKYKVTPVLKGKQEAEAQLPPKTGKEYPVDVEGTPLYVSDFEVVYNSKPYFTDAINLLNRSKAGLTAKAALDFLDLSGFTQDQFQDTFKTTVKTIQNHVTKQLTLDAALSEKLLKSFALFDKGAGLFGSAKAFQQWLNKPAYGLGYQIPLEMMDTITGIQLIEEELIRIEFGDLA